MNKHIASQSYCSEIIDTACAIGDIAHYNGEGRCKPERPRNYKIVLKEGAGVSHLRTVQ